MTTSLGVVSSIGAEPGVMNLVSCSSTVLIAALTLASASVMRVCMART